MKQLIVASVAPIGAADEDDVVQAPQPEDVGQRERGGEHLEDDEDGEGAAEPRRAAPRAAPIPVNSIELPKATPKISSLPEKAPVNCA